MPVSWGSNFTQLYSNDNFNCLGTFQQWRPPNLYQVSIVVSKNNLVLVVQHSYCELMGQAGRPLKSPKTIFFLMGMTPFIIFSYDKIIVSVSILSSRSFEGGKKQKKYKPENDQIIMLFWYKRFIIRVTILFLIL